MAKKSNNITRRRLRTSYLTSVISISLVLLLLGLVGFMILNANNLSKYVKENIGFNIELKENLRDADMQQLKKLLDAKIYVKSTDFVSKEEAAVETQKALGEDFIEFLGYNPLPAIIKVRLNAEYANPDSIFFIEKDLSSFSQINDIYYKKTLIHEINDNIQKISLFFIGFSILLLIIAITLINNTIRLSVYARRFLIHTMQLVGATKAFIRRPFIYSSIYHGFLSGLLGIGMLLGLIYLAQQQVKEIIYLVEPEILGLLFAGVIISGILISMISTFFAVNKYLNIEKDELYFR